MGWEGYEHMEGDMSGEVWKGVHSFGQHDNEHRAEGDNSWAGPVDVPYQVKQFPFEAIAGHEL